MKEDNMSDSISNLPCDLLQLILSSIPYNEAIKTSVLSTRWRQIWRPVEVNLEFDSREITSFRAAQKLNQITGSFMNSSSTPHALKLFLANPKSPFLVARKCVDKELHLEFFSDEKPNTKYINFVSESLVLSQKSNNFLFLKTLCLKSVTHLGENFVSELFSNCSVLETLKIEKCGGLENINVKANSSLENFIVMDCPNIVGITICGAPNLKTFWYQGVLPIIKFENSPELVHVILNLRDGLGNVEIDCEDLLDLLASLKDIESLTLSGWLIEYLCTGGVIFGKLDFELNKLKELYWIDSIINSQKRDSLICFLQITTCLENLFVNVDQNYPSITWPLFHQYWHEPHLWMDYERVKSNSPQFTNLKFINIMGFKQEEDHLLLMDLLLSKSFALQEMSLTTNLLEDHESWIVSKIPKSQLNRVLSAHPKRMVVPCSTIDSFFLFTQQHRFHRSKSNFDVRGFRYR